MFPTITINDHKFTKEVLGDDICFTKISKEYFDAPMIKSYDDNNAYCLLNEDTYANMLTKEHRSVKRNRTHIDKIFLVKGIPLLVAIDSTPAAIIYYGKGRSIPIPRCDIKWTIEDYDPESNTLILKSSDVKCLDYPKHCNGTGCMIRVNLNSRSTGPTSTGVTPVIGMIYRGKMHFHEYPDYIIGSTGNYYTGDVGFDAIKSRNVFDYGGRFLYRYYIKINEDEGLIEINLGVFDQLIATYHIVIRITPGTKIDPMEMYNQKRNTLYMKVGDEMLLRVSLRDILENYGELYSYMEELLASIKILYDYLPDNVCDLVYGYARCPKTMVVFTFP